MFPKCCFKDHVANVVSCKCIMPFLKLSDVSDAPKLLIKGAADCEGKIGKHDCDVK